MELITYFLLAHFIGDYPLQNGKIVEFKHRNFGGILLHTGIHLALLLLLFYPMLHIPEIQWSIGIIFVTHVLIDSAKVYFDNHYPTWHPLILYLLDQLFHWGIILIVSWFIIGGLTLEHDFLPKEVTCFLLISIIVTYFYDVTRWFYQKQNIKKKTYYPYRRNYKMMIRNFLIVCVAFSVYYFYYFQYL